MKIAVLGAGVVGIASAWYLRTAGHEVIVVDRQTGPGLETSFANGGQISASYALPWANPGAPMRLLRWLGHNDAPLLFRWHADPEQWRWSWRFLLECLPVHTRQNVASILRLALYSRESLKALRLATGIAYDQRTAGILHFYTGHAQLKTARNEMALLAKLGCDIVPQTPKQIIALEPALAPLRNRLVGGDFTASDESGDAFLFTRRLAERCAASGVRFTYGAAIERLEHDGVTVQGMRMRDATGKVSVLRADAYVVALGSYSPLLLRPLYLRPLIYPVKGYSVTIRVTNDTAAPRVSLTDEAHKIVFSRLGDRLRVAGTAEFDGYNTAINGARCNALVQRAAELFPDAGNFAAAERWAGLRPATPSNVPYIGRTRYRNLFLNTGHGTLGWTMACGSARLLTDLISERTTEINAQPYAFLR